MVLTHEFSMSALLTRERQYPSTPSSLAQHHGTLPIGLAHETASHMSQLMGIGTATTDLCDRQP